MVNNLESGDKMKDTLQMYMNYLYALREREEYGNQYGDTDEIIKMYEDVLGIKKEEPVQDNFEEVSTDIIKAISKMHYEDREKEIIKFQIMYVLCKMVQDENILKENTLILDRQRRIEYENNRFIK